ncbi:hypothetical protein Pelo_6426 [Pelomyxa schiedti]|nr:hypothetical protein Pelo_6426 [Pelomyxa schiedti]
MMVQRFLLLHRRSTVLTMRTLNHHGNIRCLRRGYHVGAALKNRLRVMGRNYFSSNLLCEGGLGNGKRKKPHGCRFFTRNTGQNGGSSDGINVEPITHNVLLEYVYLMINKRALRPYCVTSLLHPFGFYRCTHGASTLTHSEPNDSMILHAHSLSVGKFTIAICCHQKTSRKQMREGGQDMLFEILDYWRLNNLPLRPLQDFVINHAEKLSVPLSVLLRSTSQAHLPTLEWLTSFPQFILLHVLRAYFGKLRSTVDEGATLSMKGLWTNLLGNLNKDVGKRDSFTLKSTTYELPTQQQEQSTKDIYVFTCGHTYNRKQYVSQVIPQLQSYMEKLSSHIPVSCQLITAEYTTPTSCPLGCPLHKPAMHQATVLLGVKLQQHLLFIRFVCHISNTRIDLSLV